MLGSILDGITVAHGVVVVILALFHTWFWVTHGFWVPRYIHVMAFVAILIGLGLLQILPADAPIRSQGAWGYVLMVLIFPAFVYATFVVFGGPQAALDWKEKAPHVGDDAEQR